MIQNNNGRILRKLTLRGIRTGKSRNIFIIITVALSAALITGMALFSAAIERREELQMEQVQHVIYENVTPKQMEQMEKDERTECLVAYKQGKTMEVDNYMILPCYYEQKKTQILMTEIVEGYYPQTIGEIAVDKSYMRQIGKEPVLGEKLEFTWLDGTTEEFIISGFTDTQNTSQIYPLMFSKEYADMGSRLKDVFYKAAVRVNDVKKMSKDEFLNTIRAMGADYGIKRYDMNENNRFVVSLTRDVNEIIAVVLISIAVLFTSVLVIYSVFYIHISGKIRQYGQFRALGMTEKQIKKSVNMEGGLLCLMGAPPGIAVGAAAAYFIVMDGWQWKTFWIVAAMVIAANLVTVLGSIRKPANLAASVSPIEASRSSGYQNFYGGKGTSGKRKLTPFGLARISAFRNRKKSRTTAVSMGVGGIMFIMGTTLIISINRTDYASQGLLEFGECYFYLSGNAAETNEYGYTGIQMGNPINDELISQISKIEGIDSVVAEQDFTIEFEYNNYRSEDQFVPFNREEAELLSKCVNSGSVDYDKMTENKEILVLANDVAKEIYGWKFETGDKVKIRWYNGTEYVEDEFMIAGDLNFKKMEKNEKTKLLYVMAGWFLIPEDILNDMLIPDFNTNDKLLISIQDYERDHAVIEEKLSEIERSIPTLRLYTLSESIASSEKTFKILYVMVFGIAAFIIGFSIINLINTLISNILSRKQEFAMLRSIGMGDRQLSEMICGEGLILAVRNIIITLIFGSVFGYVLIAFFRENGANYMKYHFPWIYLAGYAVLAVAAPMIISKVMILILGKKSFVERLREIE